MKKVKFLLVLFIIALFTAWDVFAQQGIDPEYETIKSRVSYVPGVKVIRGETRVIVPGHESFCPNGTVFKFNNGDIQVHDRRSSDGGKTWYKVEEMLEVSIYQYPEPDGEVLMFRSHEEHPLHIERGIPDAGRPEIRIIETSQKGVFEAKLLRSKDNGLTLTEEIAKIYLPEKLDDWSGVLNRKIVRMRDGSLLMSMYGTSEKRSQLRKVSAIRSTDRGKTWHYHSTIAIAGRKDREWVSREGFNEPSLLVLPDGKILCFIRSGTSYQGSLGSHSNNDPSANMPFGYHNATPIYLSISIDGGRTWSNADPVTDFGVWPDAVLMENGIIAVSYGRPGNWLMFSPDGGDSFGPVIQFFNDLYPPDCGNYLSLSEVAPDILLAVYARTNPNNHWESEIVGTYFHVKHVYE